MDRTKHETRPDRRDRRDMLRDMIERIAAWIATDTIYC